MVPPPEGNVQSLIANRQSSSPTDDEISRALRTQTLGTSEAADIPNRLQQEYQILFEPAQSTYAYCSDVTDGAGRRLSPQVAEAQLPPISVPSRANVIRLSDSATKLTTIRMAVRLP